MLTPASSTTIMSANNAMSRLVHPLPGPHSLYRRLISTRKGGGDNQRDTPRNTRPTVQPIGATSVPRGSSRRYGPVGLPWRR